MKTDVTVRDLQKLDHRGGRLRDQIRQIDALLSGRNRSFLPLVRDGTGRFSEERARALIGQILDAFRTYLRFSGFETSLDGALSPEDEALYRSFLYCALRYAECPPDWEADCVSLPEAQGVYENLVSLAESLTPMEKTELHFLETCEFYSLGGFFRYMDEFYSLLSPTPIADALSETDRRRMEQVFRQEIAVWETFQEEQMELADNMLVQEDANAAWQEYWNSLTPEEQAAEEILNEECARNRQARNTWLETFQEKETFCREYLLLRQAYFDAPARRTLARDVRHMLDTLLLSQGLSGYLDDDVFFPALTLLDQTSGTLRQLLDSRR